MSGSQSFTYAVPLFSFPGRHGLDLNLSLVYNNMVWNGYIFNADHDNPAPGFRLDFGYIDTNGLVLTDPDGTMHPLTSTNTGYETTDSTYVQIAMTANAVAGSPFVATFKNGMRATYTYVAGYLYRPTQIEDATGNFITISYLTSDPNAPHLLAVKSVADTVGRKINFFYDSSGNFLECVTTASNCTTSGTQTYTFAWNTYALTFNFTPGVATLVTGDNGVSAKGRIASGSQTIYVLTGVTRPDGTSVQFTYGDWGMVDDIKELSNNGTLRYDTNYNIPSASAGTLNAAPTYTQQTVTTYDKDGNARVAVWTLQSATGSSGNAQVDCFAITDPLGTSQLINFSTAADFTQGMPIQFITAVGVASPCTNPPASSSILQTIQTTWTQDGAGNLLPGTLTSILSDGVTQSQVQFVSYDSHGDATDVKQFDFGSGAPGPLLQETVSSYSTNPGATIFGLPTGITVKDGAGNVVRNSSFVYDDYTVTGLKSYSTLPPGFDNTNFPASNPIPRGNLTSSTVYTNVGSLQPNITSTFAYDIFGNRVSSQTGCCIFDSTAYSTTTQYAYADSISAGPSGNQLTTSFVYATYTTCTPNPDGSLTCTTLPNGLLSSATDPNGAPTQFTYDVDNRLKSTTTADQITTNYAYDDASENPGISISNTGNSLVTKAVSDFLGRSLTSQVLNGTSLISTTSVIRDLLGQVTRASNPYGPGDTAQYSTFAYDPFGRLISTTPPAVTSTPQNPYQATYSPATYADAAGASHFGLSILAVDPAGKPRMLYQDVLGRLVRVDEPGTTSPGTAATANVTISGALNSVASGGGTAPLASANSVLTGFVAADGSSHAFYLSTNQHVWHIFWNSTGSWQDQDLTAIAGAPPTALHSPMTSVLDTSGVTRVYYLDASAHLHEMNCCGAGWADNDMTAITGAAPAAGTSLTSYSLQAGVSIANGSTPTVVSNSDGRLEAFARGSDNAIWHQSQTTPGGGWSGWVSLGGSVTSDAAVGRNSDGRLEAFVKGWDNALWYNTQNSAGSLSWSGWTSLGGGLTSVPSVGTNSDGRLEVFVEGTDNAIWHQWQTTPGGDWSGWNSLGGSVSAGAGTAVGRNSDGRLEAFVKGWDNGLWYNLQTSAGSSSWTGWTSLGGGLNTPPSVGTNSDGRLEVFVTGNDNALWHQWQTSAGGAWSGWNSLGGTLNTPASIGRNSDGRLEVFARETDNALWHNSQTSAGSSAWSGWTSLGGGLASAPTVGANSDGRLEVFVVGNDNGLWHQWQTNPGGAWSGWASLGLPLGNASIHVHYFGGNQHLYNMYLSSGSWANQDVTAITGVTTASNSALTSYADSSSNWHVSYIDGNQHVNQMVCCTFSNTDLTAATGGTLASAGTGLTSYGVSSGNPQHVYYLGPSQHLYHLFIDASSNTWQNQDLSAMIGGPVPAAGTALTSMLDNSGVSRSSTVFRHYYLDGNAHVNETSCCPWEDTDLTAFLSTNAAAPGSGLISFGPSAGNPVHVHYIGPNQHVYHMYLSGGGGWVNQDLTTLATVTLADSGTVTLNVGGFTATACYGTSSNTACSGQANDSAGQVAAALAQSLNAPGSPVTAAASGSTITLTSREAGPNTGPIPALSSTSDNPTQFPNGSFKSAATSFSGGTGPSLTNPNSTFYSYDAAGDLLQVTQGQQTRTYQYDGVGRVTSSCLPETAGKCTAIAYNDSTPNIVVSDLRGITTTYGFDSMHRINGISFSDGTPAISFIYGQQAANGAGSNAAGRLLNSSNGTGSKSYQYDLMGRTTQVTQVLGGNSYVTKYAYPNPQLTTVTYPSGSAGSSGTQVNYNFDSIGRLSSVTLGSTTLYSVSSYNAAGAPLTMTFGNGMTGSYGYNNQLQLASLQYGSTTTPLMNLNYNYGGTLNNGQIQSIIDNLVSANSIKYTYDALGRLQQAQTIDQTSATSWNLMFGYDRYGNRLSQTPAGGKASMPSSQLVLDPTTNHITSAGFSYDADGDMISDSAFNYTLDANNNVVSVSAPGVSTPLATYAYDADGQRVNKNGTYYIYLGSQPLAEYANGSSAGSPSVEYIYGGGQRLATLIGGTINYEYWDHLSIRADANSSGTLIRTNTNFPFGDSLTDTGSAPLNKWKFTTYERDAESGLDYAQTRFYGNRLGRFLSVDSVPGSPEDPQSLNRYSYVGNDPVNLVDPTGRFKQKVCMLNDNGDSTGFCVGFENFLGEPSGSDRGPQGFVPGLAYVPGVGFVFQPDPGPPGGALAQGMGSGGSGGSVVPAGNSLVEGGPAFVTGFPGSTPCGVPIFGQGSPTCDPVFLELMNQWCFTGPGYITVQDCIAYVQNKMTPGSVFKSNVRQDSRCSDVKCIDPDKETRRIFLLTAGVLNDPRTYVCWVAWSATAGVMGTRLAMKAAERKVYDAALKELRIDIAKKLLKYLPSGSTVSGQVVRNLANQAIKYGDKAIVGGCGIGAALF